MLGSVSTGVMRKARCPILVIRAEAATASRLSKRPPRPPS
jgi:hypothetical protein